MWYYVKTIWNYVSKIRHCIQTITYVTFSFEKRSAIWLKLPEQNFHLLVAETENLIPIGYCVSTIDANKKGEIDSLFVDATFRQQCIGRTLIEKSIEWLELNQASPIHLSVSYGHESVFAFYQRLGFYPRLTTLELKTTKI